MVKRACDHKRIYLRHLTAKSKTNISEVLHELAGNTTHIIVMYPAFRFSIDNRVRRTVISDLPIEQTVGLCSVSTSEYPVSMINMKELDDLMYVKLDILGLDSHGVRPA